MTLCAVILAAGLSRRMGGFKPLLPLGQATVIEAVVGLFQATAVNEIVVVGGHRADELQAAVAPLKVRWVINPAYRAGMFGSLRVGVRSLPRACRAFFVHPADIPLVRPRTIDLLIEQWRRRGAAILYPVLDGQRGHPPLIDASLAPQLLRWDGAGGLRAFLRHHEERAREVPVIDEAILLDMDTPQAYRRILARAAGGDTPSPRECGLLMRQSPGLTAAMVAHCRQVAAVAKAMAEAVNAAGARLDVELVQAAALLHDIARAAPAHAAAGAQLLERHAFQRAAAIVRVHMDLETAADSPLDEAQLVFLADKLVMGEQIVGPARRFHQKRQRHGLDPAAGAALQRRLENAMYIHHKVERRTGIPVAAILEAAGLELERRS